MTPGDIFLLGFLVGGVTALVLYGFQPIERIFHSMFLCKPQILFNGDPTAHIVGQQGYCTCGQKFEMGQSVRYDWDGGLCYWFWRKVK